MSFFAVEGLAAGYGGQQILAGVDFTLEAGKLYGVLGANGSGKTTLLKAACGILPHRGRCLLEGQALENQSVRQRARQCGYIPQRSGIGIDLSALEVVLMGFNPQLGLLERPCAAMQAKARDALRQVGLADRAEENYQHFSEGQKQLCLLARTLASEARLLFLDEPESALDFQHRHRLLALLRGWAGRGERAALVALHDPSLALNGCDGLLVLADGRVQTTLCPEIDDLGTIEAALQMLYGPVSVQRCQNRAGKPQLVLLKEE